MHYGILTPSGALHRVADDNTEPLPDGYSLEQLQLASVNEIIPDGKIRTGWQLIDGIVQPILADIASPAVPARVTPLQMRRALNAAGLRSSVEAAVALADQDTRDAWEFASVVERADPILAAMAAGLGKTDAEIDELFYIAATF